MTTPHIENMPPNPFDALKPIPGVADEGLAHQLGVAVSNSLFFSAREDDAARCYRVAKAIEAVNALAPRDAIEAHLIVQMVCAHNMAMESVKRANSDWQSEETRLAAMKMTARFMKLFQDQLRTLQQRRNQLPPPPPAEGANRILIKFVPPDGTWEERLQAAKAGMEEKSRMAEQRRIADEEWDNALEELPPHKPDAPRR